MSSIVLQKDDLESKQNSNEDKTSNSDKESSEDGFLNHPLYSHFLRGLEWLKYGVFTFIVAFSTLVILVGIADGYCVLKFNPAALIIILIAALTLLAYVEALHYSNVSVEKWNMAPYKETFPRACRVQLLVNSNEKVQKFLVGRQFFVIFVVFIIAQCTTLPELAPNFLGLPSAIVAILASGLPGIMLVLNIGQLVPQLFVEQFTLPFMNLFGCYFVTQLSFFAEWIGVCNFSWLLFHSVDSLFFGDVQHANVTPVVAQPGSVPTDSVVDSSQGRQATQYTAVGDVAPLEMTEAQPHPPPASFAEDSTSSLRLGWFDILKHIWSTGVTLGSLFVVAYGISQHYSVLPAPVPALYVIFVAMLALLFYLEGLMICIVATQYWDPETFREEYPRAYQLHKLVNQPDTVKRFIIGRQFFTLLTNFLLAQVSVFPLWPSEGYNPVLFFILIRSGIVGVMITLSFAQLLPELLAARHPVAFMNFYGSTAIVQLSLYMEAIGFGHCAWCVYFAFRKLVCGKHMDEAMVSSMEHEEALDHGADHMPVCKDAEFLELEMIQPSHSSDKNNHHVEAV